MLRGNLDYPVAQIVVNGEVWLIFIPGSKAYGLICPVYRYKGPDFEHVTRQPDGIITPPAPAAGDLRSYHMGCGLWYDRSTGQLYALAHSEYDHYIWAWEANWTNGAGWCRKKTCLATSADLGLTWTVVGDVLTPFLPELHDWSKYSGSEFEAGPADFNFYADERGGYFYITTWNSFVPKEGPLNGFHMYAEVARCAISDRMAPGKWYKYNNGAWTEPGLGGKASRVGMDKYGLYGNTIYSTYLQKYVRIGIAIGITDDRGMPAYGLRDRSIFISTCSDLGRQDWTPMAKLLDEPKNTLFGFSLADGKGMEPGVCDQTLRVYNYWLDGSRTLDVTLGAGATQAVSFPPYGSYSYEPHPEAGDLIERRRTKIVGCTNSDMRYTGSGWSIENDKHYYQDQVKQCSTAGHSIEFSFKGSEIYWRAVAAPDGGLADVYIDQQWQTTVDGWFADSALPYQFAFIKKGLDPKKTHTIKIVARGEKNINSTGTCIRHMAFEYAAESYQASAGFSSVMGKNNWYYQVRDGSAEHNLIFLGRREKTLFNYWALGENCMIGNRYQMADGLYETVRKWLAPHEGKVRIEGAAIMEKEKSDGVSVCIMKNLQKIWSWQPQVSGQTPAHDFCVSVKKGDAICFIVKGQTGTEKQKVIWNPTITF